MIRKRTVTIDLCEAFEEKVFVFPASAQRYKDAISYLCLWAIEGDTYETVEIFGQENGDIAAYYTKAGRAKPGKIFYIHAQLNKDGTYSFHS